MIISFDYYPFGMTLPGRTSTGNDYRYGFQGQEKDDELKGPGNSLNYIFRMHDPRVGRFFALDPLTHKYPHYTPYSFSGNKVIAFTELEGMEEQIAIYDDQKKEWKCKTKRDFSVKDWTDYQYALLKILTDEYSKGKCVFYGYSDYTSKVSESEKLMVPENGH